MGESISMVFQSRHMSHAQRSTGSLVLAICESNIRDYYVLGFRRYRYEKETEAALITGEGRTCVTQASGLRNARRALTRLTLWRC